MNQNFLISKSMPSVIKEIENRIRENPEKLLFAFLDNKGNIKDSCTYGDFDGRTNTIAVHIRKNYNLSPGDRVLLAYPPGLEMIWAFFACVKLGLIPVPVYPPSAQGLEASVNKMNFIAQDCGAKAVLTDRSSYWSFKVNLSRKKIEISDLKWIISDDAEIVELIVLPEIHNEILFLQYTSGSTDNPKGVMVTHDNIIQNCKNVVDHLPIGVSWLPQYHDMGLIGYYLFFVIKGGTTYGISPSDFIQRPALWLEAITKFKATASSAPNFAYEYLLLPGKISESTLESIDLSSLTFLMNASEPIKPAIYQSFFNKFKDYGLKSKSYYCAYGLAEFTLAVSSYGRTFLDLDSDLFLQGKVVKLNDSKNKSQTISIMSCGIPLEHSSIKIVNRVTKTTVLDGIVGEIYLNGKSKCKGYWNRPELTNEIFNAEIVGEIGENKWLRTGDLGFIYENELYVCGRIKDLIIIRGLNYYPQDIEAIVDKDPLIRTGSVVAFSSDNSGNEALVVVVGIKNRTQIPDSTAIHLLVTKYLGISISEIVFVAARDIPKTSSGKIRRAETKKMYLNDELNILSHVSLDKEFINKKESASTCLLETEQEESIQDTQSLFKRYKLTDLENVSLGDAGLDSMKLAEFGHDLKKYLVEKGFDDLSHEVDLKLLQRIIVSELYAIISDLETASYFSKFKFRKAFQRIQAEYDKSETKLMQRDINLPIFKESANSLFEYNTSGDVLLTGGTGFFGPFLIKSLLEQTTDEIYVLVRADSNEKGKNRLRDAFNSIHPDSKILDAFEHRVKPICGDLSKNHFGVNETEWHFLCTHIHTIYHNGAYVNYIMDYESMRAINVGGTRDVIQLAMSGRRKILNHISTTFVFGWSVKETLFESDSNAAMEFLDFGYSQSKWVSDQLVLKAMEQGLLARIFRPALISPSIEGKGYNFDISVRLLSFMLKYGIGTNAQNQVSFTPADIGANNIIAISNIKDSIGKTFHVTRDKYSTMQDVTDLLGELSGKSFKNYDLKTFVPEVVNRCTKQDLLFPLLNFLVKSVENISAMEFKRYDNDNYKHYRKLSAWCKDDPPLIEVVKGIYLFMKSNKEISNSLMTESYTEDNIQHDILK